MVANTKHLAWVFGRFAPPAVACAVLVAACGVSDPALLPDEDAGNDTGAPRPDGPGSDGAATAGSGGSGGSMAADGTTSAGGSMQSIDAGGGPTDGLVRDARSEGEVDASVAPDGSRDATADARPADATLPEACPANACGGCGALPGTVGGNCGTCGTYACDTVTKELKCNDPGVTNMCPTWCTTHPAPAGVAATDYQCLDFDNAMAPAGTWPTTVTGTGMLSRSNARASSPSYSLMTSVAANRDDAASIAWNDVGGTPITGLSVSAAINPISPPQIVPPSTGGMDLLCLASGNNRTCLEYTVQGNDPSGGSSTFTGLYVFWSYVASAAVAGNCALSVTNLTLNIWSTVTLSINPSTKIVDVTINGTTVTSNCAAQIGSDTVATVTVGATTHAFNTFGWTGYFDNIVATIRR